LGRKQEGLAMLQDLAHRFPGDALARLGLGMMLTNLGDHSGAQRELRQAIRHNPFLPDAYRALGVALHKEGRVRPAIRALETCLECEDSFEAHLLLADMLSCEGEHEHAIEHYDVAVEMQPEHAIAHCGLGASLLLTGDVEEGIEEVREADRLDPNDPRTKSMLVTILTATGRYAEAWEAAHACEALGGKLAEGMLDRLRAGMPEPEREGPSGPS
jgi:tetratricopeptide (TPR) repeat protein